MNLSFNCTFCILLLLLLSASSNLIAGPGWTEFPKQAGARVIHVANNGNDSNPGTATEPKASFEAGYEQLRDGQADWLLLRRGDTWVIKHFRWSKSGPSAIDSGWMRLGAYGDESQPRPVLESKSDTALAITPGYRSDRVLSHIAVTDIAFLASERLASPERATSEAAALFYVAAEWHGEGKAFRHMHCENLKIRGFSLGVNIGHDMEDFRLRRSILADLYSAGNGHAQGVLTSANGVLLEENIFYRIQHPDTPGVTKISFFSHPAYITAYATGVVCRGNFIFRATEGFMVRAGGVYEGNVSAENGIAAMFGQAYGVDPTPGGVEAAIRDNLFLNNGAGFSIGNTKSGVMERNLLLCTSASPEPQNLTLIGRNAQGKGMNIGVHNVSFLDNLICGAIVYSSGQEDDASYSGLVFKNNRTELKPIPDRMEQFLSSIGCKGKTLADYAAVLLERDRKNFRDELTTRPMIDFYRRAVVP